ncbi:MAG: amino acid permease [Negativicutes bacterium]|jgi:APA family basic amino acid/polyamine antiporter
MADVFRKKSISDMNKAAKSSGLRRVLTPWDLICLGIGIIIGTGVFVFTGIGAAEYAGPGLMLSFVFSGFACGFAGLAYAELAAMTPVAGSVYTYAYSALGELIAWLVGWALILEYGIGAAAVSSGWSQYVANLVQRLGLNVPESLLKVPANGGWINLPAVLLVLTITSVLYHGARESAKLNRILVAIKLSIVAIFIILCIPAVNPANWTPFLPFGWQGVLTGASFAFFSYLGFDIIANSAEETANPQRDIPRSILGTLAVTTVLYVIVTAVMTGVVPYHLLANGAPIVMVMEAAGYKFGAALVGVGVIVGLAAVILGLLYAQIRLFLAMARDGLLPQKIGKIHNLYRTPHRLTLVTGMIVATVVGLVKIEVLAEMVNIGTLFAFIVASVGVFVLRFTQPDINRPFRCPAAYVIMPLAVITCGYLMLNLSGVTWCFFCIWAIIGILIYVFYGYRNSVLSETQIKKSEVM